MIYTNDMYIYIPINMFSYLEKPPLTTNITHQHFCGVFMGISPESRDMYPLSIGIL